MPVKSAALRVSNGRLLVTATAAMSRSNLRGLGFRPALRALGGAKRAVGAGGVGVERDRFEGGEDPLVAQFSCRVQERVGGVQTVGELDEADRADGCGGGMAGNCLVRLGSR
jgi:hypothetical protein